jgi:hypothetical protein
VINLLDTGFISVIMHQFLRGLEFADTTFPARRSMGGNYERPRTV